MSTPNLTQIATQVAALRAEVATHRQRLKILAETTGQGTEAQQAVNAAEFTRRSVLVDQLLREVALLQASASLSPEDSLVFEILKNLSAAWNEDDVNEAIDMALSIFRRRILLEATPAPAPAPVVLTPPDELDDDEAAWYLAQLTGEFAGATPPWPATIEGAKRHWRLHGKRQGRKWRADAPPPAWGPQAEFAPPGTQF